MHDMSGFLLKFQQIVPCSTGHARWRHTGRSERHTKNISGNALHFYCFAVSLLNVAKKHSILQILYATEGENKKGNSGDQQASGADKSGITQYKGHDFIALHFRTPGNNCEACNKPIWHMIHPPTAFECKRKSFSSTTSFLSTSLLHWNCEWF